ncbi:MAG: YncE family protein [Acidobacteria bacterium]|nr:YncE family protein [Acidobacteriota bacterium]
MKKLWIFLPAALWLLWAAPVENGKRQKLYVLSSHGDDVTVVDVATNQILKTIKVGKDPHGIAAPKAEDVLWVATEADGSLYAIDPARDEVTAHYDFFGYRPNEIEVTSDNRFVYVPVLGEGLYKVFDTVHKKIVAQIPTDGYPHNVVVSPDDRYMYLSPYDRGRNSPERSAAQGLPVTRNDRVYIVDTATHKTVGTIPTHHPPRPIVLSKDGERLYVNTDELMGFLVLDIPRRTAIHKVEYELTPEEQAIPSRSHGIGITPDQSEVWSTDTAHSLVFVYRRMPEPPRQIARIPTGKIPYWITFTPDGKTCYVANTGDDTVSVIDVASKKERTRIQIGKGKAPKRLLVLTAKG